MVKSCSRRRTDAGTSRPITPAKAPHFFKIISSSAVRHSKLMIPRKFVSKYGDNLSNLVLLKVPSGAVWKVGLVKSKGDVWLCNGWKEFTEYYSVKFGHFLVFRYDGNSNFHVLIFDTSASEIEYPHGSAHGGQTSVDLVENSRVPKAKDLKVDDSVEILENFPCCELTRANPNCETDNAGALQEFLPEDDGLKLTSLSDVKPFCLTREIKKDCVGGTSTAQNPKPLRKSRIPGKKQSVIASAKSRALERARAFKSEYPFFMVCLQPSYLCTKYGLNVPLKFVRKYLRGEQEKFILRVSDGRRWSAKCYCMKSSRRRAVQWIAFTRDNNLKLGDVCVFEMIKEGVEPLFHVTIFPK